MIMATLTLQKLEKTEYVLIEKTFKGNYPLLDRVIHESATLGSLTTIERS